MKMYEIVAALVLRVGGSASGDMRPLSWTELGEVFGVTKDVARHRLTRFKEKHNVIDADVVVGWNRRFLSANSPEEEKNDLAGKSLLPGDLQAQQGLVVINTRGDGVIINSEDKPEVVKVVTSPSPQVTAPEIIARVNKNISEQLGVAYTYINPGARLVDDLGADSLDQVELVMAIEDEFEMEISDEDAESVTTVGQIYDLIFARINEDVTIAVSRNNDLVPTPVVPQSEIKNLSVKIEPLQHLITPMVLVVVRDGQPLSIDKSHKNFEKIKASLEAGEWQDVLDYIDLKNTLTRYSNGRVTVEGGSVTLDGERVPGKVAQRLIDALTKENVEALEGISNFLSKCDENPDHRVVTRIYDFISHNDLRLDKEGYILAYKVVRSDYLDKFSGTMDNSPGKLVQMKRNKVNPIDSQTCSFGLHVAARKYIPQYGNPNGGDKVLLCRVHPKDFVSIPTDYNSMKARVCEYFVLKDVTENFREPVGIEA